MKLWISSWLTVTIATSLANVMSLKVTSLIFVFAFNLARVSRRLFDLVWRSSPSLKRCWEVQERLFSWSYWIAHSSVYHCCESQKGAVRILSHGNVTLAPSSCTDLTNYSHLEGHSILKRWLLKGPPLQKRLNAFVGSMKAMYKSKFCSMDIFVFSKDKILCRLDITSRITQCDSG